MHQFEYEEFKKGGKVLCVICNTDFNYSRNLAADFTEGHMDPKFSSLKQNLRMHLKHQGHRKMAADIDKQEMIETKENARSLG